MSEAALKLAKIRDFLNDVRDKGLTRYVPNELVDTMRRDNISEEFLLEQMSRHHDDRYAVIFDRIFQSMIQLSTGSPKSKWSRGIFLGSEVSKSQGLNVNSFFGFKESVLVKTLTDFEPVMRFCFRDDDGKPIALDLLGVVAGIKEYEGSNSSKVIAHVHLLFPLSLYERSRVTDSRTSVFGFTAISFTKSGFVDGVSRSIRMSDSRLLDAITDPLRHLGCCSTCGGGTADSHLEIRGAKNHVGDNLVRLCGEIRNLHGR